MHVLAGCLQLRWKKNCLISFKITTFTIKHNKLKSIFNTDIKFNASDWGLKPLHVCNIPKGLIEIERTLPNKPRKRPKAVKFDNHKLMTISLHRSGQFNYGGSCTYIICTDFYQYDNININYDTNVYQNHDTNIKFNIMTMTFIINIMTLTFVSKMTLKLFYQHSLWHKHLLAYHTYIY